MRGFTKAIVAGNLTRDPEMRALPSGAQVCNFTIAANRSYKDANGVQQDQVSYLDCVAWSKPGEIINQYMRKGSPILVTGRLDQRSWEDKNTGQKRSRVEIVVEDFTFLGGDRDSSNNTGGFSNSGNSGGSKPAAVSKEVVPDDIPEDQINMDEIPF